MLETVKTCLNCGGEILKPRATMYCSELCGNRFRSKRHYRNHPEKFKRLRLDHNSYVEKRMYTRVKSRAKRKGVPFNLDVSDIVVPKTCPVLGIKLNAHHGRQGYFSDSPSLDRIDPKKGYVKGNVRVISNRANLLKSDAKVWELEAVLEDLKKC